MVETFTNIHLKTGTTRANATDNAYYHILNFLETRPEGDEQWIPKALYQELNKQGYPIAESTVRGILMQLKVEGKVFYRKKGKYSLYAATKRYANDFNYLFKTYGTKTDKQERYHIHGLSLKLEAQNTKKPNFKNALPLGGEGCGWVKFEWDNFVGDSSVGATTIMVYAETLDVKCSCSSWPFDFEQFVAWLAKLDGFLVAKGLPGIEGNGSLWVVTQFGVNKDHLNVNVNKPEVAVSLQGFKHWFAQVYDKVLADGSKVIRSEVHCNEAQSLHDFLSLASGSMSYAQVANVTQQTVLTMNDTIHRLNDMAKAITVLVERIDRMERKRSD